MSWGHKILSLARLPVPPRPHIFFRLIQFTIFARVLQEFFYVFQKIFLRPFGFESPDSMHITKRTPTGRPFCYGAVKGISKPRFACLPSCGSLFGPLGPQPIQIPTGYFHLRLRPFGFESPDSMHITKRTP